MQEKNNQFLSKIILALVIFTLGYFVGARNIVTLADNTGNIENREPNATTTTADFAPFWTVWNLLEENYVPDATTTQERIEDQKKIWGAIEGLTKSYGDPYTQFFPPKENEVFKTTISGNFEGVGMEIASKNGELTVVAPLKNSPAEKAGIKTGDKVSKIDGVDSLSLKVEDAITKIRGPKGTKVNLTILRSGVASPVEITITRDVINLPTVDTKVVKSATNPKSTKIPEDVFVIRLYSFSAISSNLFKDALSEYNNSKANKLIIDLRGNPGGYLQSAFEIASYFLPAGKLVVKEASIKPENSNEFRSLGYTNFQPKLSNSKVVILVDGGSASASEILAGALSEHGVAKLVGKKTFGKGSVQQLFDVTDKTSIKITVARWLTPNGISISKAGIAPDLEVDITEKDIEAGKDPQMEKAIELLEGE